MAVPEIGFSLRTDGIGNTKIANGTIANCGIGVAWNFGCSRGVPQHLVGSDGS